MEKNLVFILADQFSYNLINEFNAPNLNNINNLMKDSTTFEKCYSVSPICSPSRASLMSAVYPHSHGMVDLTNSVPKYRADYDENIETLGTILHDSNYYMGYFGKWHIERTYNLEKYGFDVFETEASLPNFNKNIKESITINQNGYEQLTLAAVYEKGSITEEEYLVNKAIEFIEGRPKEKPFGLFLSTYAPHDPYLCDEECFNEMMNSNIQIPSTFMSDLSQKPNIYNRLRSVWNELTTDQIKKIIACYYGFAKKLDDQIGVLINYLKQQNIYNECTIVFTADHGDAMGAHGCFNKSIMPIEENYHIPLLIKDSTCKYKKINALTNNIDIAPTILELLNLREFENTIDGESLLPHIKGQHCKDRAIMAEHHGLRFFYTQRILWYKEYKYVFNTFDYDELYNLKNDPHELENLAQKSEYKQETESLCKKMWELIAKSKDTTLLNAQYYAHRIAPIGPKCACKDAKVTGKFVKNV